MKKTIIAFLICFNLFAISLSAAETGIASWYTSDKPSALTANGDLFDPTALTAAHKTYKFGSIVEVKNLDNGKTIKVRINDRGPYIEGRVIDLTSAGAKELDFYNQGIANVELTLLSEPKEPETKYILGEETGWYTLQIGAYTNITSAYTVYQNIRSLGFKPSIEIINANTIRLSIKNVQKYKVAQIKEKLATIGISEVLQKGSKNPLN